MRVWKGFATRVLFFSAFLLGTGAPGFAQPPGSSSEPAFVKTLIDYPGPLYIFVFDVDGNLTPLQGPGSRNIRVFLWEEYTSPLQDPSKIKTPPFVDIPLVDWERGVESKVRAYHKTPLKYLFGHYETASPGLSNNIRNPGNSFEDEKVRLSNGVELNPRDYYLDPKRSFYQFRTDDDMHLFQSVKAMAESGNFGPMFPIFKMVSDPSFPAMTMALTMGGSSGVEWSLFTDHLVQTGHLSPGSEFDRVFALTSPSLQTHDPASASQFMRAETPNARRKSVILEYLIDHVLSRRVDRSHGSFPWPNVLTYYEDTLSFVSSAAELFERKIRGIRTVDERGLPAGPPIKLVLANSAPLVQYQALTPAQTANPQALSSGSKDLASIMVYNSDFILGKQSLVEKINRKSLEGVAVESLKQTFGVSETIAKAVLNGELPCSVLLTRETE
ncbi:hypothetical protein EB061_04100 [bacterium]|jgi:hypothetical protein|nr:hypothetical protein [bacterium]